MAIVQQHLAVATSLLNHQQTMDTVLTTCQRLQNIQVAGPRRQGSSSEPSSTVFPPPQRVVLFLLWTNSLVGLFSSNINDK